MTPLVWQQTRCNRSGVVNVDLETARALAVVLVAAAAAWVKFFPGAPEIRRPGASSGHRPPPTRRQPRRRRHRQGRRPAQSRRPRCRHHGDRRQCHDQRQAVGDRHRPRQQFGRRHALFSGNLDRDQGDPGQHGRSRQRDRQARLRHRGDRRRPRQDCARRRRSRSSSASTRSRIPIRSRQFR